MDEKTITHFGITMTSRARGYKLTRENYAVVSNKSTLGKNIRYIQALKTNDEKLIKRYSEIFADKEGLIYTDDWCKKYLIKVMQSFDLNMDFFGKLDHVKFENEIAQFLKKTEFFEITDLSRYSCSGYYLMILDKYSQIYIGTTNDIMRRIKQHWAGGKLKFDRLIYGQITESKLSINSFRALDTTRIFVFPTDYTYSQEDKFINHFSNEFVCNRINGGNMEFGALSVNVNMKTRDLAK